MVTQQQRQQALLEAGYKAIQKVMLEAFGEEGAYILIVSHGDLPFEVMGPESTLEEGISRFDQMVGQFRSRGFQIDEDRILFNMDPDQPLEVKKVDIKDVEGEYQATVSLQHFHSEMLAGCWVGLLALLDLEDSMEGRMLLSPAGEG